MKHRMLVLLAALAMVAGWFTEARAQAVSEETERKIAKVLENMQVPLCKEPPAWFEADRKPLFRFVQISDIHLTAKREKLLEAAMVYVNDKVAPAFVAITGDNAGRSSVKSQNHLKTLLDGGLKCPTFVIRGDNWARNFAAVFGSTRYAFSCGRIRFVFAGLDHDDEGKGIGRFEADTWAWLEKEFAESAGQSVVFLMHENILPPVFLDAAKLEALLEKTPNVAATLTGHLHYDLEFKDGRIRHILCPGLGPHRDHGFKVYEVHSSYIAVRSVEWHGGRYRMVAKYQKIDLPVEATRPADDPIEALVALPARETLFDMKMADARLPLLLQLGRFARRLGRFEEFKAAMKAERENTEREAETDDEEAF